MKEAAFQNFEELYSKSVRLNPNDNQKMLENIPSIIRHKDNELILQPISEEEIRGIILQMNPDKDPKPDGFSAHFYKRC
jgi:hypothetical protein